MEPIITPTIHSYPSQRSRSSSNHSEKRLANELIHHSTPIDVDKSIPSGFHQRQKTKVDYLTAQGHVTVENIKENSEKQQHQRRRRRRRRSVDKQNEDYLTAQGHVQVGALKLEKQRRKSPKNLPLDYDNVDVIPIVNEKSSPLTPTKRKEEKQKREDYLTAHGHVHVNHPRTSSNIERSPASYKHVEVMAMNQTSITQAPQRSRSYDQEMRRKDYREHVRIGLVSKTDRSSESTSLSDDEKPCGDKSISIIYIDEEDSLTPSETRKQLEIVPPPEHVDIHLVPRDGTSVNTHQFIKKQQEKREYLTARGHVHVDRTKQSKYEYVLVEQPRRYHRVARDKFYFLENGRRPSDLQVIEVSQSENQWIVLHDLEVSADKQQQKRFNRNERIDHEPMNFFQKRRTNVYRIENNEPPPSPHNQFTTNEEMTNPTRGEEPKQLIFDDLAKISSATNFNHQRTRPTGIQNGSSVQKPIKFYRRPYCWLFISILIILLLAGITALILAMFLIGRTTTTTATTTTTTSATTTTTTSATTTTTTSVTTTTSTSSTSTSSTSSTSTSSTSTTSTSSTSTSSTSSTSTSSTSTTSTSSTSTTSTSTSSTSSTSTTSETTTTTSSTSSTSTSSTSTTSTTSTSSTSSTTSTTTTSSSTSSTTSSTSSTSTSSTTSETTTTTSSTSTTSETTTTTSTSSTSSTSSSSTSSSSTTSTTSETTTTTSTSSTSSTSSTTSTTTETTTSTSSTSSTTDTTSSSSSTSSTSSSSSSSTSSSSTSTTSETTTSSTSTSSTSATTTTTTSTTTVTQSTTVCGTTAGRGNTLNVTGSNPSTSWPQFRFNFTAVSPEHFIIFAFQNENNRQYYLDEVSVTNVNTPSIQLLNNPSFENSTASFPGWSIWCSSTCSGFVALIEVGSNCYLGTGRCLKSKCYASSGIEFVGQSFPAIVENTYSISFRLDLGGSGVDTNQRFFFDIV